VSQPSPQVAPSLALGSIGEPEARHFFFLGAVGHKSFCLQYDFTGIAAKSEILVNPVSWEVFFVNAND